MVGIDVREHYPVHRLTKPRNVICELFGMLRMKNAIKDDQSVCRLHDLRSDIKPLFGRIVGVDGHTSIILCGN